MTEGVERQDQLTQEPQEVEMNPKPAEETPLASPLNNEDDGETIDAKHLREVFAALQVDGMWFKRHIPVILLIFVTVVAYVTNNYQCRNFSYYFDFYYICKTNTFTSIFYYD